MVSCLTTIVIVIVIVTCRNFVNAQCKSTYVQSVPCLITILNVGSGYILRKEQRNEVAVNAITVSRT